MANIEEIKNTLNGVSDQIAEAPYRVAMGALDLPHALLALQKIGEGRALLEGVAALQARYEPVAGSIKEVATQGYREVARVTAMPRSGTNELIETALGSLAEMEGTAQAFDQSMGQMDRSMARALGHLAGFVEAMNDYVAAAEPAPDAIAQSYAASVQARGALQSYVAEQ